MRISIIICTRNRASGLASTLERFAALECELAWELLVIDNRSTDETASVLLEMTPRLPRLRWASCPTVGLGAARHFATHMAQGDLLLFTDDDCYPSPELIDSVNAVFAEHPRLAYVGGSIHLWDQSDLMLTVDYRTAHEAVSPGSFVAAGQIQGANLAIRKEALEAIGGFDPELGAGTPFPCEDIDVVARLSLAGYAGAFDPRPLVYHHHGRKEQHRATIMRGYDLGRGAYFAKFILNRQSRGMYVRAWLRATAQKLRRFIATRDAFHLGSIARELQSAVRYVVMRRSSRA